MDETALVFHLVFYATATTIANISEPFQVFSSGLTDPINAIA